MIKINTILNNKSWKNYLTNPSNFIQNKIKNLNRQMKIYKRKTIYCTLLLSGDREIKKLNKKFRKKNKPTDILSFPFLERKNFNENIENKKIYLGDIAISYEEFCKKNKNDYKNGFIKIFIHGFLHLLNFEHKSNKDFKIMNSMFNEPNAEFNNLN